MIETTITHYAESFETDLSINVIIKNLESKEDAHILYLLHGYSGNHRSWNRGSMLFKYIQELDVSYPIYVIMPSVINTFYTDLYPFYKGHTYIAQELPALIQNLFPPCTHAPEFCNIAGLSMGGYGAILLGLSKPSCFAHVASFSGVLDITERFKHYKFDIDTTRYGRLSGDIPTLKSTDLDLFHLASLCTPEAQKFSSWYFYCGDNDYLIEENRAFREHLHTLDYTFFYEEQKGYEHNWDHWDYCIKDWLPKVFV